jgi:hypothetical protein
VTLNINNVSVTPAFADEFSAGLYQLNVTIPPDGGRFTAIIAKGEYR